MKAERNTILTELRPETADEAAALIGRAMNPEEEAWARTTIRRHFHAQTLGFDDGRRYFALMTDGELLGLTGLHHYEWGPDENVWLGWFAVDPKYQGQGFGVRLMTETEQASRALGYRKLFIETYDTPTFSRALRFYRLAGFRHAGTIENYLPDGSSMLVFLKELPGELQPSAWPFSLREKVAEGRIKGATYPEASPSGRGSHNGRLTLI